MAPASNSTRAQTSATVPVAVGLTDISKRFEHRVKGEVYAVRAVSIVVAAETFGPGALAVEGLPFQNWRLEDHPWRDVATLVFDRAGRGDVALGDGARHNRWFRVRNAGAEPLEISSLAFLGRR